MTIPTTDPNIFILEQSSGRVVYTTASGETWEILGTCNACGACEIGAIDTYYEEVQGIKDPIEKKYQEWTGVSVGESGACLDLGFGNRLDIPVRPEIKQHFPNCALSGNYINAN